MRVVAPWRVDDDEFGAVGKALEHDLEALALVGIESGISRHRQGRAEPAHRRGAVVEIAAERALPRVEIERRDPAPLRGKRHRAVHRGGGLAGAAFLVGEGDDVRHVLAKPRTLDLCVARAATGPAAHLYRSPPGGANHP